MKKVTLFALDSSYIHTNLAVRCLREPLERAGFEVTAVEGSLRDRRGDLLRALYAERADIYGFSAYVWNISELAALGRELKILLPECVIIIGGPETTGAGEGDFPFADFCVDGEGEVALPALCRDISNGTPPARRVLRGDDASEVFLRAGTHYTSADAADRKLISYESSRGCPFSCAYCTSSVGPCGVRAKDAATVVAECGELERIFAGQPGRIVKFLDRTFNFDRRRALEIWRALSSEGRSLTYHFEICADLVDDEALGVLASVPPGRFLFEVGVQSTNPATLAACGRTPDVGRILKTLKALKKAGNIHLHADLIAGLPLEGYESFARSFDEVYPLCDVLQLGFLKLLPGTPLRAAADAGEYGIAYSPSPPYEVLRTDCMSYAELCRLHDVDDALERFGGFGRSGEGGFRRAIGYLTGAVSSPFAFFESLADAGGGRVPGQTAAYRLLAGLGCGIKADGFDSERFLSYLRLDFLTSETAACPDFLRPLRPPEQARRDFASRTRGGSVYLPATEAHLFAFSDSPLFVDRKNRRVYDGDGKPLTL